MKYNIYHAVLTAAFVDGIVHHVYILQFTGDSYPVYYQTLNLN